MSSQWQHRGIVVHDGGLTTVRAITAIRTDALRRGATVTVTALHGPGGCRAATAQTADRTVVVGDLHDPDELLQAIASTDATHWWPTMPELAAEPELTARVAAAGVRVIGPAASTLSRWRQPDLARLVAEVADQHPVRLGSGPLPPTARLVEVVVHGRQARVQLLAALDRSLRLGERTLLTRQLPLATLPCGIEGAALALAMASRLDGVATVTFAIEDTAAAAVLFGIRPGADAAAAGTDVDALQLAAACEDAADGTGVDTVADPDLGATSSIAEADAHPSDTPDATTTTWTAEVHALPATPGGVPGRVELLQVPSAPGLTVEPAVRLGEHLPHATPVAAVTVHGPDAVEARLRLQLALTELRVVLSDGATDEGRLLSLLQRPELQHDPTGDTGPLRVGWVAALEAEGALEDARHADLAVLLAAVEAAGAREREERRRLFSSARRGRPHLGPRDDRPIELQLGGHVYRVVVRHTAPERYELLVDGVRTELVVARLGPFQRRASTAGRTVTAVSVQQGADHLVEVAGVAHRVHSHEGTPVRSPGPGVVVAVLVEAGTEVAAGTTVAVVESMKMERTVTAPVAGRVRRIVSSPHVQVDTGTPLVELELTDRTDDGPQGPRLRFTGTPTPDPAPTDAPDPDPAVDRRLEQLAQLRTLVLGYDLDPGVARQLAAAHLATDDPADAANLMAAEVAVLAAFADVRTVVRSHRSLDAAPTTAAEARSPEALLHTFLRTLDHPEDGLPAGFLADLDRALAAHDVHGRDRTSQLEEALFRLARANRDVADHVPVVLLLLQRWAETGVRTDTDTGTTALEVLGRLVAATVRSHPQIAELAGEVLRQARLDDRDAPTTERRHGDGPRDDRVELWRYERFDLHDLATQRDLRLYRAVARANHKDERLLLVGEVRRLDPHDTEVPAVLRRILLEAFDLLRTTLTSLPRRQRSVWNRITLHVDAPLHSATKALEDLAHELAPAATGLGLERVDIVAPRPVGGGVARRYIRLLRTADTGFRVMETDPPTEPITDLDEYTQRVVRCRQRGLPEPYELLDLLTSPAVQGVDPVTGTEVVELDLDDRGRLVAIDRPPGRATAGIIVARVTHTTQRIPEGMTRIVLLGDPTKALGAITWSECERIRQALDLAEELGIPVDWFALSAGARIAMDSGTENLDAVAAVLRRLVTFTQGGGEVNVVVTGINVGAQPYWNAEATMLMHTRGILVMTPDAAMVLTGKQALDYSGGVSAEDNHGIGGYERVMGPNGQGQYWAPDIAAACRLLLTHHEHSWVVPGERFPRRLTTADPEDRDVRPAPHRLAGSPLTTVGEVFDERTNPDRKQPFDIRSVMRAVLDVDHAPRERWADLAGGSTAAVWDATLGGIPVCAIGVEAHALPRGGDLPADGPEQWSSGTLYPMASWKIARAINATSGTRPVVLLANLAGFDGSPESMRKRQLEFGAEIGRAVVNHRGPIVFCVVSRYHGGAFVVFSNQLHDNLQVLAVEGAHASVIGGAPAAAVVFARDVATLTEQDPEVQALTEAVQDASGADRARLRAELEEITARVRAAKLGEVAQRFDLIHSVERARVVGSIDRIVPAASLRPEVLAAVQLGMARALAVARSS